ncbi:MAG: methyl-accepting chemotaxis protein [Acidimicrobiia bacterium]
MQPRTSGWTVSRQITAGLVVLVTLVAALVLTANLSLRGVQGDVNTLAENVSPAAIKLLNIDRDGYQAQLALERLVAGVGDADEELANWQENSGQTVSRLEEFRELSVGLDGEDAVVGELEQLRGRWLEAGEATIAAGGESRTALLDGAREAFSAYRDRVDVLEEQLYEAEGTRLADAVRTGQNRLMLLNWLALGAAAVLGTVIVIVVSRKVRAAINGRASHVQQAATMLQQLAGGITERATSTAHQADSARHAADDVALNVADVNVAVEELSACIHEIASNAAMATSVAADAVDSADAANRMIEQLGESSDRIGEVVKVIDAIAEQTNLLALNATIEAARAGEAGRGFSVVANEVKELAGETARATGEIAARVAAIQQDTRAAIDANRTINDVIGRINELQHSIAAAMEEQSITTAQIARGASDAAVSSRAISDAVGTVADQAAHTVDAGRQTGESAELLGLLAVELEQLV